MTSLDGSAEPTGADVKEAGAKADGNDEAAQAEALAAIEAKHEEEWRAFREKAEAQRQGASKKKLKQIEFELQQEESDLRYRQHQELDELEGGGSDAATVEEPVVVEDAAAKRREEERQASAEDLMPGFDKKGPSKAQKRREKKEKEAAALRKQRDEEMKDVPNFEELEKNRMADQLTEVGLKIVDIAADGNCLYRAISHQLAFQGAVQQPDHEALRGICADYMQAHADDYLPFLEEEFASPDGFEKYLAQVRGTEWGGELELRALSEVLGHPIKVYQGKGDPIIDIGQSRKSALCVSFHKYLYSNAHYNALVPR